MTVVVKNDTLRDIETRAATTRLHSSFCSKRNLAALPSRSSGLPDYRLAQPAFVIARDQPPFANA
jgi:hypothetical protein